VGRVRRADQGRGGPARSSASSSLARRCGRAMRAG
jgi:hypothetical protein